MQHPIHNIREFGALFENSLSSISKRNVPCIISGDFNIDLSKYDSHTATTDYVDMLLISNFLPIITMPSLHLPLLIIYIILKVTIARMIFLLKVAIYGVVSLS